MELYYSVYAGGQYGLRLAVQVENEQGEIEIQSKALLEDFEIYNLERDPADPGRVLFDGLQFSTNTYLFGSLDPSLPTPEEIAASVQSVDGISGRVETLIVLPDF